MRSISQACIIDKDKRQNVLPPKNNCKTWSWRGVAVLYTPRLGRFGRGSGTEQDSMGTDRVNCGSGAIVPNPGKKKSIDIKLNPGRESKSRLSEVVAGSGPTRPRGHRFSDLRFLSSTCAVMSWSLLGDTEISWLRRSQHSCLP